MNGFVPYDPGVLPAKPAPKPGDTIHVALDGLPPYKDEHFSIRNPRHKIHCRFVALREAAIRAMDGRAPHRGAVQLHLVMHARQFEPKRSLVDYTGGVMDTLDGSHGASFTYLPVVYEDDCQVCSVRIQLVGGQTEHYEVGVIFLGGTTDGPGGPSVGGVACSGRQA